MKLTAAEQRAVRLVADDMECDARVLRDIAEGTFVPPPPPPVPTPSSPVTDKMIEAALDAFFMGENEYEDRHVFYLRMSWALQAARSMVGRSNAAQG